MTSTWGYTVWALLLAATLAMWALSHVSSRGRLVARPSTVLARLATDPWFRVPLVLAWAFIGWHLFAR